MPGLGSSDEPEHDAGPFGGTGKSFVQSMLTMQESEHVKLEIPL